MICPFCKNEDPTMFEKLKVVSHVAVHVDPLNNGKLTAVQFVFWLCLVCSEEFETHE